MNIQFCDLKYRKTNSRLKVDLKIKGRKLKVLSLSFFRPKIRKPIYHKYIYGLTNQVEQFNELFRKNDPTWIIRIYVDKSPFTMRYSTRESEYIEGIQSEKNIFDMVFENLNKINYVQIIDVNCQYRDEDRRLA